MKTINWFLLSTQLVYKMIIIPRDFYIKNFNCFQLDLKLNSEAGGDTSTFIANGEWDLVGND